MKDEDRLQVVEKMKALGAKREFKFNIELTTPPQDLQIITFLRDEKADDYPMYMRARGETEFLPVGEIKLRHCPFCEREVK